MPTADAVLAALDPEQRAVATALAGPVCVLAGAGTGKTRAITHRIAYGILTGVYDAPRVLAVTFTTRAAGELRGRLRGLGVEGVQARTFHSAALRQARYFWPRATGAGLPALVESKLPLVAAAAARCRVPTDTATLRDLAAEVEWSKVSNVLPEGYPAAAGAAGRATPLDPAAVGKVYAAYEVVREQRGVIDMEDVLLSAVAVLEAHPDVADEVRRQYRHFVVDEYQDVSPLQQRLLELWLGEREEVCVVGDAAQTIYSFAGARPDYLTGFPRRHPGATVVRLERDYRSTPQVVDVANRVLQGSTVGATTADAASARLVLRGQRPPGPAPTFAEHADEVAEAQAVAQRVAALLREGTPAREIAVLYRVNAMSEAFEQALADAGLPFVLRGAARFFDRPEVRQAVLLLRGALRAPGGDASLDGGLASQVRAVLSTAGWGERPPGGGAARERWESLAALVALTDEVAAARPDAGLADLVAEVDARAATQHAPLADGVVLASLHAAKGLEWDAVFLVGCQEGTLPISYAETPEQLEEERRLLYVGITRARVHLALSWSLARTPGGRGQRRPSRFLVGVRPQGSAAHDAAGGGARGRRGAAQGARTGRAAARCRVCGTALRSTVDRKLGRCGQCPGDLDEALFARLREWRLATARRLGVPAYVVFTDATLTALAEARPATEGELAAVPGVGRTKLERYGGDVLVLCAGDALEAAAQENP